MLKWLLVALLVIAGLLLWRISMGAKRGLPRVGDTAPDFRLSDASGKERALAEFRGKRLVLYFFPRADTPG